MALTEGLQAASATPATDQMTLLNTCLTNAGWTYIHEQTAATMGTTAVVKVYASPGTTLASNVYTGCILYVEYDDANLRLRFRTSEKYDSAAAGSPASNVKWAAPGCQSNTAQTPTANYAISDSYVTLFQTQSTTSTVGWVNIPVLTTSFYYWMGANNSTFVYANNVGGLGHWVMAGELEFLGNTGGGGEYAVYLAGSMRTTNNDTSWTFGVTTGGGNVRVSRDPFSSGSTIGLFCYGMNGAVGAGAGSSYVNSGDHSTQHKWFTGWVWYPVYLHGYSTVSFVSGRSHLATMSSCIIYYSSGAGGRSNGDVVTVNGATYVVVGATGEGTNTQADEFVLAIKSSDF